MPTSYPLSDPAAELDRLHGLALTVHATSEHVAPLIGWTLQDTADSLCSAIRQAVIPDRDPATERCDCGKPRTHLQLPEDHREWACLVPNFDPATGRRLPPVGRYAL